NDVGLSSWEEINDGIAGSNYGWPNTEGETSNPAYRSPLYAYPHDGTTCAITGAAFYNPAIPQFPAGYTGDYFFADLCAGWIKNYDIASDIAQVFAQNAGTYLVDIKVNANGSLYYLMRGDGVDGRVYRINYVPASAPLLTSAQVDLMK